MKRVLIVIAACFLILFLLWLFSGNKAYRNASEGMSPTILKGENIVVDKQYYGTNTPRLGDVIVFDYPADPNKTWIKRVIAIENEIIESKNKTIYVNGQPLSESYVHYTDPAMTSSKDNFAPLTVPKDCVFVMGDNRDRSIDSRDFGFIQTKAIRGKAKYIYSSEEKNRVGMEIK